MPLIGLEPKPGDLIAFIGIEDPYDHWGVYVGDDYVVHIQVSEGEFGEESRVGVLPGWGSWEKSDMCGLWRGDYRIKPEPPSWSRLTDPCMVHLRGGRKCNQVSVNKASLGA
ncbi:uncharacterized protein [Aquarana catesbeiana]|uniref:uncharacterized protein isoform X3 n=1 Tax=Aquarana catesbeiana TaxID=8400 RepID=UPI003CCA40A1